MLRPPERYSTIQAAVNAARSGDLVLIAPGEYREQVEVPASRPRIVIRDADRNRVVLDGGDRLGDGMSVHADGVAVENLTVRRYLVNGVVWSLEGASYGSGERDLQGWRGSYVTAYDNGLYGVYASGHPDSGVYAGPCSPCRALVHDSTAERNHVGDEATSASGDVAVAGNIWRRNRVGVQIISLRKVRGAPQAGSRARGTCFVGNRPRRTAPDDLEASTVCEDSTPIAAIRLRLPASPPQVDYRTVPAPPPQVSMPAARTAPPAPAVGLPEREGAG